MFLLLWTNLVDKIKSPCWFYIFYLTIHIHTHEHLIKFRRLNFPLSSSCRANIINRMDFITMFQHRVAGLHRVKFNWFAETSSLMMKLIIGTHSLNGMHHLMMMLLKRTKSCLKHRMQDFYNTSTTKWKKKFTWV